MSTGHKRAVIKTRVVLWALMAQHRSTLRCCVRVH